MRILITRPQENTIYLSHKLQHLGYQMIIDPLLRFIPISNDFLKFPSFADFEAVVTTSQQAIRCLAHLTPQRHFPLWCVGAESGKLAKNLGFQTLHIAEGSAKKLIEKLVETLVFPLQKPILHVSGDVIQVAIVEALQTKGIDAQRIVVYQTQEATDFSHDTYCALKAGTLDAVLFYSSRTARVFRNLCRFNQLEPYCSVITALCLSGSIKTEIFDLPWKKVRVAKKTSTDDLLMALRVVDNDNF